MKGLVLVVEDDPQQSESIKRAIERRYPQSSVEVLETESDFRLYVTELARTSIIPQMVVCGVMLPWVFPDPVTPDVPPEVKEGTFRKAGLRCWKYFRQKAEFQKVPWIYFTVLDDITIEFSRHADFLTGYVQKAGSIEPLFEEMKEMLEAVGAWTQTEAEVTSQFLASPEMARRLRRGLAEPVGPDALALGLPS